MTTAAPSTALATIQPAFGDPERLALAGYLAGYRGLTREAYALDLRQFTIRCRTRSLPLESHATALDRNELGALLVAAGLGPPLEHALISPLTLNGLRVSEATGADIEHLGLERGHRT
jgi:integrase/recombinase XerD